MRTEHLGKLRLIFGLLLLWALPACTDRSSSDQGEDHAESPARPNLLLIVADDLGYTDLGPFGSEIATPNIDSLAASGVVLTNYYTTPICAPTRSELMSGTDHHRAGEGMMQVNIEGMPGYEGRLNERVVTLAQRLRDAGYHTYMAGKWHLGTAPDQRPFARGFERSFAMLDGGASHYGDQAGVLTGTRANYSEDGESVESLPEDFYSTDYYTDKILGYLREQPDDGKPFFAYLAYTAPHWPIQAPDDDVASQRGRYAEGYEVLRQRRFEAWQEKGFASEDAELPELPADYPAWGSLAPEEQAASSRVMEIYAAMVGHMDSQIGRVLQYLEDNGQLDNTIVLFQSDNGAEATPGHAEFGGGADNSFDNLGRPGSFAYIGPGWAEAGSAPFYLDKSYTAEGGIHVPAIVSGGALRATPGRDNSLILAYDVAPTFLELAGAGQDAPVSDGETVPISGRSFAGLLRGESGAAGRGDDVGVGREHGGHGAIRKGDWKLLWLGDVEFYQGIEPAEGGPPAMSGVPMPRERFDRGTPAGTPIGSGGPWRLYNLAEDPAERHDLSAEYPDKVAELLEAWNQYVADYGVLVKSGDEP